MSFFKKILPWSTFGQMSLVLLLVCLVSGILLAIPFDINNPYNSISLLILVNPSASWLRNIHYWSANIFLVFALIHIYDHFSRNYKIKISRGIWFRLSIGVLVIFLAMLTGFLLKADADSLQARRILDELIKGIPLVGSFLSVSLFGASESLQVVYVHHIATFTIFIVIIILEHNKTIWPPLKETVIVMLFLLVVSFFFQAPLHDGLNPVIKGPWYFVGLQEILHWLTTPTLSILLILLFVLLIFFVPFTSSKKQFLTKRLLLILSLIYFGLTITGYFFRGPNWQWIWPGEKNYSYYIYNPLKILKIDFTSSGNDVKQALVSPDVFGRKEGCLACHADVSGFSASHNPEALGCFSCHGGDPFTLNKNDAHYGMILIPGNLADAERTCGTTDCHPDIVKRVNTGLMATLSGMISVDRFVFDEQNNPDKLTTLPHLGNTAADEHLKNLCVRCHLGNEKDTLGPVAETSRGGGCLACHLNYNKHAEKALNAFLKNTGDTTHLRFHPSVDLNVTNDHCFGCHSRSGRISTNYEGWHETTLDAERLKTQDTRYKTQEPGTKSQEPRTKNQEPRLKIPNSPEGMPSAKTQNSELSRRDAFGTNSKLQTYRIVEGNRVFRFIQDDVHHRMGMECIDCHHSYELMGDGTLYAHEEDQVDIQCSDCHFDGEPRLLEPHQLDNESAIIASLRFENSAGKKYLATQKRNNPLINTWYKNDTAFLIGKNSKKVFAMKPPAGVCSRDNVHSNLNCTSCHAGWAPSCIGCHNEYDRNEPGYNMLANKEQTGSWVEYTGEYNAYLPALGIREEGEKKTVIPVIPGMVLTIDLKSFDKKAHDSLIFKRLFAPAAPHTTQSEGRNCKSCHNDPVALGFGDGKLDYQIENGKGKWVFFPKYEDNIHDGLPEDAWTGFLTDRTGVTSTRTNVRPFSVEEQKKILTVGACLTCHEENSEIMQETLLDFKKVLARKSEKCILPDWKK